jgi:tetratricopeptide (TPR) repeat protein
VSATPKGTKLELGHDNSESGASPHDAHRYELVDRLGLVLPPRPYGELVEQVRHGQLFRNDLLCKDEGPQLPLGEYPEFAEVFDEINPPTQSLVDDLVLRQAPAFVGLMEPVAIAGVFGRLLRGQRTGRLFVCNAAGDEWSVAFKDGQPINTGSNLTSDAIGELLKAQGLIDEAAFDEAVTARTTGEFGRMGSTLVTLDKVTRRDLHRVLSVQAMDRLLAVFRQTDGTFRFVADASAAEDEVRLLASVRDIIETGLGTAIPAREITQVVNDLGDPVLTIDVPEALAAGLDEADHKILEVLGNGEPLSRCMAQVAQIAALTIAEARTRVLALIKYGVAGVADARYRELEATLLRLQGFNHFRALDVRRSENATAIEAAFEARCIEYGAIENADDSEMVRGMRAQIRAILEKARDVLSKPDERVLYERAVQLGVDFEDPSVRARLEHEHHMSLGKALLAQDKPAEAAEAFDAALELMPSEALAHLQSGWASFLAGSRTREDAQEAIRRVEHAIELKGEFDQAWLVVGQIHRLSRNKDEAEAALRKALALNPNNQLAQSELNLLFRRELDTGPGFQLEINLGGIGKAALLVLLVFAGLFVGANQIPGGLTVWPDVAASSINQDLDGSLKDTAAFVQIRLNYNEAQLVQAAKTLEAEKVTNKAEALGYLARFDVQDVRDALSGTRVVPAAKQLQGNQEYYFALDDGWWWTRRGVLLIFGLLGLLLIARKDGIPFRVGGEQSWWVLIGLVYGIATGVLAPRWTVLTHEVAALGSMALVHVLAEQIFFFWFLGRVLLKGFEDVKPAGVALLAVLYGVYQLTFFAVFNAEGASVMSMLQDVGRLGAFVGGAYGVLLWRSGGILAPLVAHLAMYTVMVLTAS